MSPSGGSWVPSDLVAAGQRPGFYANILASAPSILTGGVKGILAIPVTAEWGPLRSVVTITRESDLVNNYGPSTYLGTAYYAIREALRGGAQKILAYRMAGAAAAKATRVLQDATAGVAITVTAKYEGARANNFTINVSTNLVDGAQKDVKLLESGVLLETFSGLTNAAIVALINASSAYMTAVAGGGTFVTNVTGAALTGGNSGLTVLTADYTLAMAALEPLKWDVFAPVGLTDSTIQASLFAWIVALRANGQRVFLVLGANTGDTIVTSIANAALFNNEGVVWLAWGVTDQEGVVRKGADFIGRIAGMIAAFGTDISLTFEPVSGIRAVELTPTNAQVKSGLVGGLLMITDIGTGTFHVEQGINTLTTLGAQQTTQFKKIRVVRILDLIFNALTGGLAGTFIGQIANDTDGQASVISSIAAFLETLSAARYIKPLFTVALDPAYPSVGDKLFLLIGVKPVDSIDYIYTSLTVS